MCVKLGQLIRALDDPTSPFFRFSLFLLKMMVLARICWPVAFNMTVGGGLVVAAAVDLTWTLDLKKSFVLFLVHLVLAFIFQARGELCLVQPEPWDWDPAFNIEGSESS